MTESYDAGDAKSVNNARKKKARETLLKAEVVKGIMSVREGRAFFYEKLNMCGVFTTPFVPGQVDTTTFNAGKQWVGHMLMADIMEAAPEMYWRMIKEAGKPDEK